MLVDIAEQRLIRRAPPYPLPLGRDDQDYITGAFLGVERVFGVKARPALPPEMMPARALMRQLLELRRSLHPQNDDQHSSYGRLASAIMLVDAASSQSSGPQGPGRR
jgi:hypothetical protein